MCTLVNNTVNNQFSTLNPRFLQMIRSESKISLKWRRLLRQIRFVLLYGSLETKWRHYVFCFILAELVNF